MSLTAGVGKVAPGEVDVEVAARALRRIKDYLAGDQGRSDPVEVLVEAGAAEALVIPRPALEMVVHMLAAMANGQGVQIIPINAELTTQQAADLLNVSRPYLIGLLERGEIEYRLVGRHRRISCAALRAYARQDDRRRRAAIEELTSLDQELGSD